MNEQDKREIELREMDNLIEELKEFRQQTIERLDYFVREFAQTAPRVKSRAESYWVAHIKVALADDNYSNRFQTDIASTVGEILDEMGVEYKRGEELETAIDLNDLLNEIKSENAETLTF